MQFTAQNEHQNRTIASDHAHDQAVDAGVVRASDCVVTGSLTEGLVMTEDARALASVEVDHEIARVRQMMMNRRMEVADLELKLEHARLALDFAEAELVAIEGERDQLIEHDMVDRWTPHIQRPTPGIHERGHDG